MLMAPFFLSIRRLRPPPDSLSPYKSNDMLPRPLPLILAPKAPIQELPLLAIQAGKTLLAWLTSAALVIACPRLSSGPWIEIAFSRIFVKFPTPSKGRAFDS